MMPGKPHLTYVRGRWHVWNRGYPERGLVRAALQWAARMNLGE